MKKIFTMLLVLCLVFSASFSVFAGSVTAPINCEQLSTDQSVLPRVEIVEEEITYLKYITSLSKRLNISINEAKKIDKENTQNAIRTLILKHPDAMQKTALMHDNSFLPLSSTQVVYKRATKSKWFNSDFSALVAAEFKVLVHGSFEKIVQNLGVYSYRRAGASNSTWDELNTWSDPRGGAYPTDSVTFSATGQFEVRVSSSGSAGIDLAGFSVSHTIGTTKIYLSNPMSIRHTFSVGQ